MGVDEIVKMRKEVWPKIEEVGNILVNDTELQKEGRKEGT